MILDGVSSTRGDWRRRKDSSQAHIANNEIAHGGNAVAL